MSLSDQVPLAEVKAKLSALIDALEREHGRVVITKHGRPAAVLLSIEDLESLEETVAVLSDPDLMADLREAEGEVASGAATRLTKEQALALVRER
jgi:antitoxin YefM